MANVAVVGVQWGDEGKGKIVDWLSERADVVVRFQGGHNAGHTLVINGSTYKLSLLPSGVVRPGKLSVIGNGVVVDPWALLAEIETLRKQGVAVGPDNLLLGRMRSSSCRFTAPSTGCAKRRAAPTISAPPGAASVRPMRTRSRAAPSGSATCSSRRRSRASSMSCCAITTPC